MKKRVLILSASLYLLGCSAMTGLATDTILGASKDGIEVTAQVGKENTKGILNTKLSKDVAVDDVSGDALFGSGNTITNEPKTMIGLVFAGMFLPMLLLFYLLPAPKWLVNRHKEGG